MTTETAGRRRTVTRATRETDISVSVNLDGGAVAHIATGIGFFDHMLTLLATHGGFDLTVQAKGDLEVDPHHTVEDCGIVLGQALHEALGKRAGINRYGWAYVPMDEALARTVIDLSGRPYCWFQAPVRAKRLGDFDTELCEDFFAAFANHGRFNLHIDLIRGRNSHHIIEAVFKSAARALRMAAAETGRDTIPSTKGRLD